MARWLRKKLFNVASRVLTKPRGNYNRILPTDLETLRLLPRMLRIYRGGDNHLLSGIAAIFEAM